MQVFCVRRMANSFSFKTGGRPNFMQSTVNSSFTDNPVQNKSIPEIEHI